MASENTSNILEGLISPQAAAELRRLVAGQTQENLDPKIRAAAAKVIADDFDAADGKLDGIVQKKVLLERMDKLAENSPFSLSLFVTRTLARWLGPETLESKTMLETFGGPLASSLPATPRPSQESAPRR